MPCTPTCLQTRNGKGKQIGGHLCLFDVCISQTSDASLLAITLSMTVSHKHTHTETYNGHPSLTTLICTHGHPSLHSWSPFSALMATLLCTHGHPYLHSWPPFSAPFSALMVTLSLQSSPFSALMVTLLCTHGHSVAYPERCPSAVGANIIKHYTFILYFSRKTSKSNNE